MDSSNAETKAIPIIEEPNQHRAIGWAGPH